MYGTTRATKVAVELMVKSSHAKLTDATPVHATTQLPTAELDAKQLGLGKTQSPTPPLKTSTNVFGVPRKLPQRKDCAQLTLKTLPEDSVDAVDAPTQETPLLLLEEGEAPNAQMATATVCLNPRPIALQSLLAEKALACACKTDSGTSTLETHARNNLQLANHVSVVSQTHIAGWEHTIRR